MCGNTIIFISMMKITAGNRNPRGCIYFNMTANTLRTFYPAYPAMNCVVEVYIKTNTGMNTIVPTDLQTFNSYFTGWINNSYPCIGSPSTAVICTDRTLCFKSTSNSGGCYIYNFYNLTNGIISP